MAKRREWSKKGKKARMTPQASRKVWGREEFLRDQMILPGRGKVIVLMAIRKGKPSLRNAFVK
ncbi:MAG: hypothetical protein EBS49_06015 [Verrucomicrobia bacterium]|nr:hypothetical protein [Verrucomicrobiota bacterium]